MKAFLAPPVFPDEDKTRIARVLNAILLVILLGAAAYPLALLMFPAAGLYRPIYDILFVALVLFIQVLMRRGHVALASALFVVGMWLVFTVAMLTGRGVQDNAFHGYVVVALIAGLLLGGRAALAFALASALAGLAAVYCGTLLPPRQLPADTALGEWAIHTLYVFAAAAVLHLATHSIRDALQRVRRELVERQRAEQEREILLRELETKNVELERFTYTVSHDLKSPLITIHSFLGFLEKDALSGNVEQLKSDIARIADAIIKMQNLLDDLLNLSRVGRIMNPPEQVSFETLAREALRLVEGRVAARGVAVEIAPGLPMVYGDRARLIEALQNLLDNAVKFMGDQPNPRVEIGMREPGTFFVRDNGIGIAPEHHERIFGLFDKLDPQSEGTGVGLALVKRIVEVHGGRIWVESEGRKTGSTFCFTLPRQRGDAPSRAGEGSDPNG
jgi:signal transduction histidine kinase